MLSFRMPNALIIGAAGVALALALACSAESPTGPEQRPGPPATIPDPLLLPVQAAFAASDPGGPDGLTIFFENDSICGAAPCTQDGANWSWDFGDRRRSGQYEPVHTYREPGVYLVVLTVSNARFTDRVAEVVDLTEDETTTPEPGTPGEEAPE